METVDADVLVVGAGIAGLSAALAAAPRRVLLLCIDEPSSGSSSALAQGGVAAALAADDSVDLHVADTLVAAAHSGDAETVRRIVGAGADAIGFLEAQGVAFDRRGSERSLHLEAGHQRARIVHAAGDRTGAAIVAALWSRVGEAAHVEVRVGWRIARLLLEAGGVTGAIATTDAGPVAIRARETVLATGGIGQLFAHTTNSPHSTGDGLAAALAAGAEVAGLEFLQFHPTALAVTQDPLPLLTEALRGAGAMLVTAAGRRLMEGRHRLLDLAPRDVVARAVYESTVAGERVFLDARDVFGSARAGEFPGAYATARRFGLEPARDPLPVTAAVHFHMGGVVVDACGRTSVPHLWACGEVAYTGLHGANRLASNSLLEAVVVGCAAGRALSRAPCALDGATRSIAAVAGGEPCSAPDPALRRLLWEALGPVRSGDGLSRAAAVLEQGLASMPAASPRAARHALALAMVTAARLREESRGAHWRRDFPDREATRDGGRAVFAQSSLARARRA